MTAWSCPRRIRYHFSEDHSIYNSSIAPPSEHKPDSKIKMTPTPRGPANKEHATLLSSPSPSQWRSIVANRPTTVRQDIWTVLRFRSSVQPHTGLQYASYVLELSILTLVLLNVVVAISETSAVVVAHTTGSTVGSKPIVNDWTDIFLLVSTIIFSIEYMLRLWSCVEDDRYCHGAITGR